MSAQPSIWGTHYLTGIKASKAAQKHRATEKCDICDQMFKINVIGQHREACLKKQEPEGCGNNFCACGRPKPETAETCFRCEDRDLRFAELDRLIAAGKRNGAEAA